MSKWSMGTFALLRGARRRLSLCEDAAAATASPSATSMKPSMDRAVGSAVALAISSSLGVSVSTASSRRTRPRGREEGGFRGGHRQRARVLVLLLYLLHVPAGARGRDQEHREGIRRAAVDVLSARICAHRPGLDSAAVVRHAARRFALLAESDPNCAKSSAQGRSPLPLVEYF
eukprot:CAMPEP_0115613100 /NCGR_PEP_ID=MMETSP0272-20121206/21403_1 /TAXON_ID=71861 /ORGANISM="Scrippsiella trochoidea, Strain CCMP3099" /LENGTH=173 /DNA_ID=CAMNT_0003048911 /DNA_START=12 /DNA_END=531 /DNA_ORIENTATION=-